MGFWNKLGKVALVAAPYVAAPFTGGASLMATGATQGLAKKWAQKDAEKAMAKGLAPSKFDKYLTMAGDVAGVASSFGAMGGLSGASKAASTAGKAASTASRFGNALSTANKVANAAGVAGSIASQMRGSGSNQGGSAQSDARSTGGLSPSGSAVARNTGSVMPRGGYGYRNNPMNQLDQSSPNLASSIFQGREEAMRNQPFRSGYTVNAVNRDDEPYSYEQGPITPRRGRRREAEAV